MFRFCKLWGIKVLSSLSVRYSSVMAFDLGSISHPRFGKVSEYKGQIPFILPQGKYKVPMIITDRDALTQMTRDLFFLCGSSIRSSMTSDQVKSFIEDCIICTAFLSPRKDIKSSRMQSLILVWIYGIYLDDVVDKRKEKRRFVSYKTFLIIWNLVITNNNFLPFISKLAPTIGNEIIQDLNNLITTLFNYISSGHQNLDHQKFINEFIRVSKLSCEGKIMQIQMFSNKEQFHLGKNQEKIFQVVNAFEIYVEFLFGTESEVTLSPDLRSTLIFQLMMNSFMEICYNVNAIVGLKRDLILNSIEETPILLRCANSGMSLFHSLHYSFQNILDAYSDLELCSSKLLEMYPNDPALILYIQILKEILDGQLYAYQNVNRYGMSNYMKIKSP